MSKKGNIFAGGDNGYSTARGRDKVTDLLAAAQTDLTKKSQQDLAPGMTDPFAAEETPQADPIFVEDLTTTPVHNVSVKAVAALDMNKTVTEKPQDPTAIRAEHDNSINTYMALDKQIKAEFMEALNEVDPGVGKAVGGMIHAQENSGFMMAVSLADDIVAPGMTAVWAAIDAIVGNANNPNSVKVQEAIAKTIENLQAKTDQQALQASNRSTLNVAAPPVNWHNVEVPQQMIDFLARDIENDPFMQEAAKNEKAIAQMEDNSERYNEVYLQGRQNVTADMVASAAMAGDRELVGALVGGDHNRIDAAERGKNVDAVKPVIVVASVEEARLFTEAARDIGGVKPGTEDIERVGKGAKDVLASLGMEPKLNQLVPKFENSFAA